MRTRRQATIEDLRHAIDRLPRDTRVAMLDGIRQNSIIVGAYTDHGGICPMLAAFRTGGRASCISFANAWDAFAFRSARRRLARRATRRELLVLTSHLEASLLDDDATSDLGIAIAQHEKLVQARAGEADPGDTNRILEPQTRPAGVRLRVMRRHDKYERALAWVEAGGGNPAAHPVVAASRARGAEEAENGPRGADWATRV